MIVSFNFVYEAFGTIPWQDANSLHMAKLTCGIGAVGQPNTTLFVVNFDPDRTRPRDLEDAFGSALPSTQD